MKRGAWYTVAAALAAVVVVMIGRAMADGDAAWSGVRAGVAIGVAVQVVGFWVLSVWALPTRPVLAHGAGMMTRLLVVGCVALLWLPRTGLPAAPTLLSLVGVFFLTMLVEPVALKIGAPQAGVASGRSGPVTTSTRR
ncbi:MAG: hypothetical protein KY464_09340 [Gemmatimonadetes bacterium]|nr:hypothetical protein [Gemmatimonadota bacterium]